MSEPNRELWSSRTQHHTDFPKSCSMVAITAVRVQYLLEALAALR